MKYQFLIIGQAQINENRKKNASKTTADKLDIGQKKECVVIWNLLFRKESRNPALWCFGLYWPMQLHYLYCVGQALSNAHDFLVDKVLI